MNVTRRHQAVTLTHKKWTKNKDHHVAHEIKKQVPLLAEHLALSVQQLQRDETLKFELLTLPFCVLSFHVHYPIPKSEQ